MTMSDLIKELAIEAACAIGAAFVATVVLVLSLVIAGAMQ